MSNEIVVQSSRIGSLMLPRNQAEVLDLCTYVSRSGMFGKKTTEEVFTLMLLADAEGMHPAAALKDYHVIHGQPTLKADAMLARFYNSGGKTETLQSSDDCVEMVFIHENAGRVVIKWDNERVAKAQLGSNGMHNKFPAQMKRARCISEGVRATNPTVLSGLYTPEEVHEMQVIETVQPATNDEFEKEVEEQKLKGEEAAKSGKDEYTVWWKSLKPSIQKNLHNYARENFAPLIPDLKKDEPEEVETEEEPASEDEIVVEPEEMEEVEPEKTTTKSKSKKLEYPKINILDPSKANFEALGNNLLDFIRDNNLKGLKVISEYSGFVEEMYNHDPMYHEEFMGEIAKLKGA